MLLSDFTQKKVFVNKTSRGVCLGIGFSLKNYAVKYLLCASIQTQSAVDFAVGIAAVTDVNETITLSRLRPVYPKTAQNSLSGYPSIRLKAVTWATSSTWNYAILLSHDYSPIATKLSPLLPYSVAPML